MNPATICHIFSLPQMLAKTKGSMTTEIEPEVEKQSFFFQEI